LVLTLPSTYFRFERHVRAAPVRSPALERFLAYADMHAAVADWRSEAQLLIGGPAASVLRAAPAAFLAEVGAAPAAGKAEHVFLAAPLHARASMTSVGLPHSGVLALTPGEARDIAADFNERLECGGARLFAGASGRLFCTFDAPLTVETRAPDLIQGYDLWDFQPTGPDAARLKKLGSEVEMWLFGHPLNQRRSERGELEITGLWLWGGDPIVDRLPPRRFEFTGTDVLFSAWAGCAPAAALGRIVHCAAAPGEPGFDKCASAPLDEAGRALRRGRVDALYFSCGTRCFTVRRMPRWPFRRTRPWWEHFDDSDS